MSLSARLAVVTFVAFVLIIAAVFMTSGPSAIAVFAFVVGLFLSAWLYFQLEPMVAIIETTEQLADGNTELPMLPEDGPEDIRRLATATNTIKAQYEESLRRAGDIVAGRLGIADVAERVERSSSLSDADEPHKPTDGPLEDAMIQVTNQMRRVTMQARVIADDDLSSPLLDERVPGEMGDAFGLMVRNLRALTTRAREIAAGDLTGRVAGEGELTEAFNKMVDRFHALAQEITQTGIHISSSAEEILAVLREQEFAATHQASGVEETQRTMETLLSSAKRIAESAQTVFKSAERTQANNRTVAERIAELKTHSERISELLEVIKSIADRSDLLALNASLEGMRAGEAGKGFTLVAAEMRRLAESIKESVGDIKELLSDIRESALASVMATEEGSNLSERTTESALKITLITQQQQSGTEQVTQSMEELSTLINHGVAGMRQVTSAADELVHMSEDLRVVIEQFQTGASPGTSSDFPAARRGRSRRAHLGTAERRRDSDVHESAVEAKTREERDTAVRRLAETSGAAFATAEGLSEASENLREEARETLPLRRAEDPSTIEFAGLSSKEEREMLREALGSGKRDAVGSSIDSDDELASEAKESETDEQSESENEDIDEIWDELGVAADEEEE